MYHKWLKFLKTNLTGKLQTITVGMSKNPNMVSKTSPSGLKMCGSFVCEVSLIT